MNKYLAAATTALTLSVATLATPAFADQNSPVPGNSGRGSQAGQSYDDNGSGRGGYGQNERGRASYEFNQTEERGFDGWEPGWKRGGYGDYRHQSAMPHRKLIRRLERQGFYDVRGLRQSQWGFGLRAFAFNGRGFPVMLRINAYTGQVLDVRAVGGRHAGYGGW